MEFFEFKVFVDFPKRVDDGEFIDMGKRLNGGFMCKASSLKEAIKMLSDAVDDVFPDLETIVGISFVSRNGKSYDYNYKNRVIQNDEYLKERFWC